MLEDIGMSVEAELKKLVPYPVTIKSDVTYNSAKGYIVDCCALVEYKGLMVLPSSVFDEIGSTTLDDSIKMLAQIIANDINNVSVKQDEIIINGIRYAKVSD